MLCRASAKHVDPARLPHAWPRCSKILQATEDQTILTQLRRRTYNGRPLGTDRFIAPLEALLNHRLRDPNMGRPGKAKVKARKPDTPPRRSIESSGCPDKSWQTLGTGIEGGSRTFVSALVVYNGELIAGGRFTTAGGISVNNIARWNGTSWGTLSSGTGGVTLSPSADVTSLTLYNGELIAAGTFTMAGGVSANRIARWNGRDWKPLGSGIGRSPSMASSDSSVAYCLAVYNGELIVGGNFASAGGQPSAFWARWGTGAEPADFNCDSVIDTLDLGVLLSSWSLPPASPGCRGLTPCPADLNHDGIVNTLDLGILLAGWTL